MSDNTGGTIEDAQNSVDNVLRGVLSTIAPEVEDGPVLLSGWVTVMAWVDANGESYVSQLTSNRAADHQTTGLLHTALYDL